MSAGTMDSAKRDPGLADLCRPVAETSPIPMAAVDEDIHIIRYVNPAFCLLVDKSKGELIGNPFSIVVTPGEECLSLLDRVYRTGKTETSIGQDHPNSASHSFYWSYDVWPISVEDSGPPAGIVIQVIESTPYHLRTAALNQALIISSIRQQELTDTAEVLNTQLERANKDLKQFGFAVSHDLQEPLRMVTIYSELLVKSYGGQLQDEASRYLEFISKGTEQMRQLLADLLAYTRMGEEKAQPAESIDLNLIVQKVMGNLKFAIEESGAVVACDRLPTIHAHPAHFAQLFQNLIGNAIKYRGERPLRVDVSAEEKDGEWRFAIADNGMGINPIYHEQIFGVFKRLHGNTIPGTGIGLAICRRVVERYGGRIWVESQVGQGTTFYFTLPQA